MVRPITSIPYPNTQSGVVIFTGGVNEAVNNLEMKEGELLECRNYMEVEGPGHGYQSFPGYEACDGTQLPSEVEIDEQFENHTIDNPPHEDGVYHIPIRIDDLAREQRRREVTALQGEGPVRGVHMLKGSVYGLRDIDLEDKRLCRQTNGGWDIVGFGTASLLNAGGSCEIINARFAAFPPAPLHPNTEMAFMADGVSTPVAFDDSNIIDLAGGDLPSEAPAFIAEFDQRLWLGYKEGWLYHSELGNPAGWDGANGAGVFPTGGEITGLILAPGNVLIVFMRHQIKLVYVAERPTADFTYQLREFSQESGALPGSVKRLFGAIVFLDDRGPVALQSSDRFGDFAETMITKRVQRTYLAEKENFIASIINRELNQWRVFFKNGSGICFSFDNARLKGATFFHYEDEVACAAEGENRDGHIEMYFGDNDGYVYKIDSGTSFNGKPINTKMVTAYSAYRSPRINKRFMRLTFEMTAARNTEINVRCDYDYGWLRNPRTVPQRPWLGVPGGIWGESIWSKFVWGFAYVQNPTLYIEGYGANMSMAIWSNSKYRTPHIINNAIADFDPLSQKM